MPDYPLLHAPGWLDVMLRHQKLDASEFALQFTGRSDWPVREIAEQMHCYPRAEAKLGPLHRPGMIYQREALEQASGYAAAAWRARNWIGARDRLRSDHSDEAEPSGPLRIADLTGGLGIDSAAFALAGARVDYCERTPVLAAIARHNHELHGLETRIQWHTGDGMEWLESLQQEGSLTKSTRQSTTRQPSTRQMATRKVATGEKATGRTASRQEGSYPEAAELDLIYIDPSRRQGGRRVHSLQDSEPDVTRHLALIRSAARRCLIKLSPMMDPVDAARSLEDCAAIYAVSVDGELKELLADCIPVQENASAVRRSSPIFHAVMLDSHGNELFRFSSEHSEDGSGVHSGSSVLRQNPESESAPSSGQSTLQPGSLLFEPDPALFKMRLIDEAARRYGLVRIHPQIGYLTGADAAPESFPGKVFHIRHSLPFKPRALRKWLADNGLTRVHIHQRGFPLTVYQLYSKLGCRMGEEAHLFATLAGDGQKVLIVTDRAG